MLIENKMRKTTEDLTFMQTGMNCILKHKLLGHNFMGQLLGQPNCWR